MKEQLRKLFDRLKGWKGSIPFGEYRYIGHPTIYTSTSSETGFQPSEQEILVHRYVNRLLVGSYIRFHLEYEDKYYNTIKSPCWQYAKVVSAHHANDRSIYGYLSITCLIANTLTYEDIIIKPSTRVTCEVIPKTWFYELIKMVVINTDTTAPTADVNFR